MKRAFRDRIRVSYYEPEEPSFDEYVFCSRCGDYVYEYCSIHGRLLVIPDHEVPSPTGYPALVPRSALTIPRVFLHLAPSTIPGAGIGVFSTLTLPLGVRFGPYRGLKTDDSSSTYCWQIFDGNHKPAHMIDARDPNKSNWMRYVNCSRHHSEQNLVAYQYRGQLYYRTIKVVPRFTELLVFYGGEFASRLHIDVSRYHSPVHADILVNARNRNDENAESHGKVNEDSSIVEVKEDACQISNTQEFTNDSICETQVPTEITSERELNDFNKSIDEIEDQDKVYDSHVCNYCLQCFNEKAALNEHITTHNTVKNVDYKTTNRSKYLCPICNCTFGTKSKLINHEIQKHDSKIEYIACSQCDYKTLHTRYFKDHVKTHNKYEYTQNTCQICGLKFKDVNKLTSHSKFHDTNKQFACKICGYRFKTNYYLKCHSVCHSAEKPFKCSTCNKSFPRNYTLRKHIKLHKISSVIDLGGPSMS